MVSTSIDRVGTQGMCPPRPRPSGPRMRRIRCLIDVWRICHRGCMRKGSIQRNIGQIQGCKAWCGVIEAKRRQI
eukprot:9061-Eustigmatos_ZCMA.PRE.1